MPIYEYTCQRCGDFEVMQRISEDPLKKCPTCGATVTKLISRSAFHLKGSGWYMTDYARNGTNKSTTEESQGSTTETKERSTSPSTTAASSSSAVSAKESSPSA
ncbi:MAG: zinc ribbon domain-containing protein [Candidatus Binatia bacterium]|nr:zinc ribbon domain-containing protein [Candidatus Binatia bacterium]